MTNWWSLKSFTGYWIGIILIYATRLYCCCFTLAPAASWIDSCCCILITDANLIFCCCSMYSAAIGNFNCCWFLISAASLIFCCYYILKSAASVKVCCCYLWTSAAALFLCYYCNLNSAAGLKVCCCYLWTSAAVLILCCYCILKSAASLKVYYCYLWTSAAALIFCCYCCLSSFGRNAGTHRYDLSIKSYLNGFFGPCQWIDETRLGLSYWCWGLKIKDVFLPLFCQIWAAIEGLYSLSISWFGIHLLVACFLTEFGITWLLVNGWLDPGKLGGFHWFKGFRLVIKYLHIGSINLKYSCSIKLKCAGSFKFVYSGSISLKCTSSINSVSTSSIDLGYTSSINLKYTSSITLEYAASIKFVYTGSISIMGNGSIKFVYPGSISLKCTSSINSVSTNSINFGNNGSIKLKYTSSIKLEYAGSIKFLYTGSISIGLSCISLLFGSSWWCIWCNIVSSWMGYFMDQTWYGWGYKAGWKRFCVGLSSGGVCGSGSANVDAVENSELSRTCAVKLKYKNESRCQELKIGSLKFKDLKTGKALNDLKIVNIKSEDLKTCKKFEDQVVKSFVCDQGRLRDLKSKMGADQDILNVFVYFPYIFPYMFYLCVLCFVLQEKWHSIGFLAWLYWKFIMYRFCFCCSFAIVL